MKKKSKSKSSKSVRPLKVRKPSLASRRRWLEWEMTNLMAPRVAARRAAAALFAAGRGAVLVAEGDSWFDYPPGMDILDHLEDDGYHVHSVASAGATVEDMVYGPDTDQAVGDFFKRDPSQLAETMRYIRERRPQAVLFSGGGNDIAGDELAPLLNNRNAGGDPLRTAMVDALFDGVIKEGYRVFLRMVEAEAKAQGRTIPVIGHGYDYPFPDGRGVINFVGFHFLGPWLAPALNKKGYSSEEGRSIIARLIDRHQRTLDSLKAEFAFFHPLDLRGTLPRRTDWANELHPTNKGFRRVASRFRTVLDSLDI